MYILLLKVWKKIFSMVFDTIRTMFSISYYFLKRTFTIICDNDLIHSLFPQKTTIWSERIFCIGLTFLKIYTKCLYCVIAFYFTILCICWELYILCYIVFVCMLMLWFAFAKLPDLNKETTYLLISKCTIIQRERIWDLIFMMGSMPRLYRYLLVHC